MERQGWCGSAGPRDARAADRKIDELGSAVAQNHYAVGWAHAMDTPYQWTKQVASHFGGTRNGTIIHWPNGIKSKGRIRSQFHHVIDVAPTVLEAAGLPAPTFVNGVMQEPLHGVSMMYSFDDSKQRSVTRRSTSRWSAIAGSITRLDRRHASRKSSWVVVGPQPPLSDDVWELYDTTKDWSQSNDLAAKMPEKLEQMKRLFDLEASKYNVFPLDDRKAERTNPDLAGRPQVVQGNTQFFFQACAACRRTRQSTSRTSRTPLRPRSRCLSLAPPASSSPRVVTWAAGALTSRRKLKYHYNFLAFAVFEAVADSLFRGQASGRDGVLLRLAVA
jgi:arylsulfatase